MSMDEQRARRVVLAQAIETADAHGKLLSVVMFAGQTFSSVLN